MSREMMDSEPELSDDNSESYSVKELYGQFPSPFSHFRVAVYIRYQLNCLTPNYLSDLEADYAEMLSRYPEWDFVGFYVDRSSRSASLSELEGWSKLMADCEAGLVDLILVGSAFSFEIPELYLCVRFLATRDHPVGVFFEEQNLYSLSPHSLFLTKDSVELTNNLQHMKRRKL